MVGAWAIAVRTPKGYPTTRENTIAVLQEAIRSSFDNKFLFTPLFCVLGMVLLWISLLLIALCLLWMENLPRDRAFFDEAEETGSRNRQTLFARSQDRAAFSTRSHTFQNDDDADGLEELLRRQTVLPSNLGKPDFKRSFKQEVDTRPRLATQLKSDLLFLTKDFLSENAFPRIASRYYPLERFSPCFNSSISST